LFVIVTHTHTPDTPMHTQMHTHTPSTHGNTPVVVVCAVLP
jgi:hypothetical protein